MSQRWRSDVQICFGVRKRINWSVMFNTVGRDPVAAPVDQQYHKRLGNQECTNMG